MKLTTDPIISIPQLAARPTLGSRYVVAEAVRNFLDKVLSDVTAIDWHIPFSSVSKRVVALRVIVMAIIFCENNIVQYLQQILQALYKAIKDDDKDIVSLSLLCVELLGKFVKPQHYLPFVIAQPVKDATEEISQPQVEKRGNRTIISVSAEGGPQQSLPTIFSTCAAALKSSVLIAFRYLMLGSRESIGPSEATQITKALTNPDLCDMEAPELLHALIDAILTAGEVFGQLGYISTATNPMPPEVRDNVEQRTLDSMLLYTLLTIRGCEDASVPLHAANAIERFSIVTTGSPKGIYSLHCGRLLHRHGSSMPVAAFTDLVENAADYAQYAEYIVNIFVGHLSTVNYSNRVTSELQFFTMLRKVLSGANPVFSAAQLELLLRTVVLTHGKFHPGPPAHLFRKLSISCLSAMLHFNAAVLRQVLSDNASENVLTEKVVSTWLNAIDADDPEMRLCCIAMIPDVCILPLTAGQAADALDQIVRRLDDGNDELRLQTAKSLRDITVAHRAAATLVSEIKSKMAVTVKKLLVHLDDHVEGIGIKDVVCEVLANMAALEPVTVQQLVQQARPKHFTSRYCDRSVRVLRPSRGASCTVSTPSHTIPRRNIRS